MKKHSGGGGDGSDDGGEKTHTKTRAAHWESPDARNPKLAGAAEAGPEDSRLVT